MYPNSDAMEVLSSDSPENQCVLLGGDCQCYYPKRECHFRKTHVFFSKKGKPIAKREKLVTLQLQREQAQSKIRIFELRIIRISKLIETIESTK